MDDFLLISGSEKGRQFFADAISQLGSSRIDAAKNGAEARRLLIEGYYDVIIINSPLPDENGLELACDLSETTDSGIIMIVRAEYEEQIRERVEDYGVYVVEKPIIRQTFYAALKFISTSKKRMALLREKDRDLRKQMEDIKTIDRAKCTLIQYLGMTENQAHKYIEKQAMDQRRSRRSVAEDIITTYEN